MAAMVTWSGAPIAYLKNNDAPKTDTDTKHIKPVKMG